MIHLKIEQNNIQENVSSAVIQKLYELATSGDLDASSYLAGNLYVLATYQEYIDVLTDQTNPKFRDLTITAGSIYIMFADSEVKRVMATQFGDGTNVSVSDLTGVTTLPSQLFRTNSNIETFDELKNLRGITSIGSECFLGSSIQSITLDNITAVYNFAFFNCTSLSGELSMPNLTTIERNAFQNIAATKINFGGHITSTPLAMANECRQLTQISGLSSVTQIGEQSFRNCTALTQCDIDFTKVTSTGNGAFENCSHLVITDNFSEMLTINGSGYYGTKITTLVCPKLTSLGQMAFRICTSLTSVNFTGSTFTTIDNYTFDGCTNLTLVTLPNTCTTINREAFRRCTNLNSINLSNVTTLGNFAFADCTSLTSVDVSNVENYGTKALNWSGITRLTLLKLTEIGVEAFNDSQFTYLEFGPNLISIGIGAFWDSRSLTTLVFRSTTPPTFSDTNRSDKFLYGSWMDACTIYVPDASINDYQVAWPNMATQITGISNLPQS